MCIEYDFFFRMGCLKFRQMCRQIAYDVEPFKEASTIAKLAMVFWRQHYLQPNLLVNLPENGLRPRKQQSNEAQRFFALYSKLTGKTLQTFDSPTGEHISRGDGAFGSGESESTYYADCLLQCGDPTAPHTIIEYNGCAFHGNKKNQGNQWKSFAIF